MTTYIFCCHCMSFIGRMLVQKNSVAQYKYITYCGLCTDKEPYETIYTDKYRGGFH